MRRMRRRLIVTAAVFLFAIFYFSSAAQADSELLRLGSRGENVIRLQQSLIEKGYLDGQADGIFGPKTESAVMAFQKDKGIEQDGIVGPVTQKLLYAIEPQEQPDQKEEIQEGAPIFSDNEDGEKKELQERGNKNEDIAQAIIDFAVQYLGKPYVYRASGPNAFDCSGFTCYVYGHFGIDLPRSAKDQGYKEYAPKIAREELKPGDLVFFNTNSGDGDLSDHAGIYIGNGDFIHASSSKTNGKKVVISPLDSGYYQRVFSWGRRVLK